MALLRTIWWAMAFIGGLLVRIPTMLRAQRLKKNGDDAGAYALAQNEVGSWALLLLRIAGVHVTVTGKENIPKDRAVVFTPNHQGDYDIPLMLTQLDALHPIVAKIETLKIPLVRTWMRMFDCVFLDRKDPRNAVLAIREAEGILRSGRSVVIFPEGTRSRGDNMGEFKNGAFKMAFAAKAPIVPIAIDGSYRIMEANHNLMKPGEVKITILPPVETAGLDRAAQKTMPAQIAALIAAELPNP